MEREVSLSSGSKIYNALIDAGHRTMLLDIYMGYNEEIKNIDSLFSDSKTDTYEISSVPPSLSEVKKARIPSPDGYFGNNVLKICHYADIVFIALHGADGENGKIQAVFDLLGIKYTGTGYNGSMLALDKHLSKQIMSYNNILTAEWKTVQKSDCAHKNPPFDFPLVIKPSTEGSSIGVSIVYNKTDYENAINNAFLFGNNVVVEKYIAGREFSVGVVNSVILPPIEIIPNESFFDYQNKYQKNCTQEICPANLTDDEESQLKSLALKVHNILHLGNYSRIDFIQGTDGNFYCLEANTLPGMTPESLLPKEAKADGIDFSQLCNSIVQSAFQN